MIYLPLFEAVTRDCKAEFREWAAQLEVTQPEVAKLPLGVDAMLTNVPRTKQKRISHLN